MHTHTHTWTKWYPIFFLSPSLYIFLWKTTFNEVKFFFLFWSWFWKKKKIEYHCAFHSVVVWFGQQQPKFRPTKRNETKNPWLCVCFLCKHVRKHIFTEWGNYNKKKEKFKFQFMKYNNNEKKISIKYKHKHTHNAVGWIFVPMDPKNSNKIFFYSCLGFFLFSNSNTPIKEKLVLPLQMFFWETQTCQSYWYV